MLTGLNDYDSGSVPLDYECHDVHLAHPAVFDSLGGGDNVVVPLDGGHRDRPGRVFDYAAGGDKDGPLLSVDSSSTSTSHFMLMEILIDFILLYGSYFIKNICFHHLNPSLYDD